MDRKEVQLQALERLEQKMLADAKERARPRPFQVMLSVPARLLVAEGAGEGAISDPAILQRLHGLREDGDMVDAIFPDDPLAGLSLAGGDLELRHDGAGGLCVETRYRAPEAPTQQQMEQLIEFTRGQWSDGAGSNFPRELPGGITGGVKLDWNAEVRTNVSEISITAEETKRLEDELKRATESVSARIQASRARLLGPS
jgi:hypothetical protein